MEIFRLPSKNRTCPTRAMDSELTTDITGITYVAELFPSSTIHQRETMSIIAIGRGESDVQARYCDNCISGSLEI